MIRFKTIKQFAKESGYTEHAIYQKKSRGDWLEGEVWIKAPDGRILIDIEGFNRWASSNYVDMPKRESRSPAPLR